MKKFKLFALFLIAISLFSTVQKTEARNIWVFADSSGFIYANIRTTSNLTGIAYYSLNKSDITITATSGNVVNINYVNDNGKPLSVTVGNPFNSAGGTGDSLTWNGAVLGTSSATTNTAIFANLLRQACAAGYKPVFNRATTWTIIKAKGGTLHTVNVDSIGVGGLGIFRLWDGTDTSTTGTLLFSGDGKTLISRTLDIKFNKGLYLKQALTTPARLTISYYLRDPAEDSPVYNLKRYNY